MRLKLISCQVFCREMAAVIARSRNQIDLQILSKGLHNIGCVGMRERLQTAIDEVPAGYDAILLDTDNGPEGLTQARNNRLYSHRGLRSAYDALRPGGVLAVWSTDPNAAFTRRLGMAGFRVEEQKVFAHRDKGTKHHLWFAMRP